MLSARILGTDARAGTPLPGRLSPLRAGVLDGWESVDGSAGHCLPYLFSLICAVRPASAGRWALIEPRRIGLASCAGLPDTADRFLNLAPLSTKMTRDIGQSSMIEAVIKVREMINTLIHSQL